MRIYIIDDSFPHFIFKGRQPIGGIDLIEGRYVVFSCEDGFPVKAGFKTQYEAVEYARKVYKFTRIKDLRPICSGLKRCYEVTKSYGKVIEYCLEFEALEDRLMIVKCFTN